MQSNNGSSPTTETKASKPAGRKKSDDALDPSRVKHVEIGIEASARKSIVRDLNRSLSNEMVLLTKTRKAHWDIVGPQFYSLHKLWDDQYVRLNERIDELAERIRQLGGFPVATMAGWLEHSSLVEEPGMVLSPTQAVAQLLVDHELVIRILRKSVEEAGRAKDVGTADFLTACIKDHEQMAWMLRAFLEGDSVQQCVDDRASIPHFA